MPNQKRDDHLRAHPLLSQLLEAGTSVRAFRGYVGPEKESGRVRLYPSLGDLGFCIEIDKGDIVASAAAPETLLPHGGTVIWVKPDAEVICHGDRVNTVVARRSRRSAGLEVSATNDRPTAAGRLVEVQAGRLNIQLRPRVMSTCASCSCSSCETHPSCTSTCNQVTLGRSIGVGP